MIDKNSGKALFCGRWFVKTRPDSVLFENAKPYTMSVMNNPLSLPPFRQSDCLCGWRQPGRWRGTAGMRRHGRLAMVLEGGVAGAQPLHKGGRLRPTAQNCSGQWLVVSG